MNLPRIAYVQQQKMNWDNYP